MNRGQLSRRRFIQVTAAAAALLPIPPLSAAQCSTQQPLSRGLAQDCVGGDLRDAMRARAATYRWNGTALGAHTSLAIVHHDQDEAARLCTAARAEITRLERLFSLYLDDSLLVQLNTRGRLDSPPADWLSMLTSIAGIHQATQGTFDPTVQRVWSNNGIAAQATDSREPHVTARRSSTQLHGKHLNPASDWTHVRYSASRVQFDQPRMAMTLNGIAQGFISEHVAELLRANGLTNVLVNIGEIVALGRRTDGKRWQVGLAERDDDAPEERIALSNQAIATSAPLGSEWNIENGTAHIIDPATSRPCVSPWRRLSVVHPSATVADGLSTGLILHQVDGIKSALKSFPDARVIAVRNSGHRVELRGSGGQAL